MSKSPEPETLPKCSNIVFIDITFSLKVKQLTIQLEIVLHKKKVFHTAKIGFVLYNQNDFLIFGLIMLI
jgi:hypothetical protein